MATIATALTTSSSDHPAGVVYTIKAVLVGVSPMIWRRLLVTDQTTIDELHTILQTVFAWSDERLHRFTIHAVDYGQWRPGAAGYRHDPRTVHLARFGFRVGERFTYEYDFFSEWRVALRVEAILDPVPGQRYPRCTGGARSAPPEDCGGVWDFLALRQQHSPGAIQARLLEFAEELLAAKEDQSVREALGDCAEERLAELNELIGWLHIDRFDRRAVNQALRGHFRSSMGGRR